MPKSIVFILLISLIGTRIIAQPDPITIQFVEAEPIWEHLSFDTNYYDFGGSPDINKYTLVSPFLSQRDNNNLLILNLCRNPKGRTYGYILENINISTGEVLWQSFNTYFNGGIQDYYRAIHIRPDGNIEFSGVKRKGIISDDEQNFWEFGAGQSNFIRKVFNISTGEILKTVVSLDSISGVVPVFLNFYPVKFDSVYLMAHQTGKQIEETVIFGYDFYQLDNLHNRTDTLSYSEIIYEYIDSATVTTYGSPPFIKLLNDSTIVCLLFKDKQYPDKAKVQLLWIDISDLDEISVIDKKQVEELMVIHNNFNWFRFEVEGNSIHLSQPYHNPETQTTSSYLTILQSNGEVDQYFDQCTSDGFEYTYLHLIFTGPHYNYYSAFPSRTGRSGFDLIKLNHDIGTFTFISSLTSANMDEEFTREMQVCKLYEDGKFIIGAYTKKLGDIQNSAVKYYCFDGHDLGLETTTSTNESIDHNEILLYPNPSNGIFNISFSNATSGQIEIFNILGQQIDDFVFNETTSFQIDNSDYIDGLYFAVITDTQRSMRDVIKIVISKSE